VFVFLVAPSPAATLFFIGRPWRDTLAIFADCASRNAVGLGEADRSVYGRGLARLAASFASDLK
jgi:hypothetical protein